MMHYCGIKVRESWLLPDRTVVAYVNGEPAAAGTAIEQVANLCRTHTGRWPDELVLGPELWFELKRLGERVCVYPATPREAQAARLDAMCAVDASRPINREPSPWWRNRT